MAGDRLHHQSISLILAPRSGCNHAFVRSTLEACEYDGARVRRPVGCPIRSGSSTRGMACATQHARSMITSERTPMLHCRPVTTGYHRLALMIWRVRMCGPCPRKHRPNGQAPTQQPHQHRPRGLWQGAAQAGDASSSGATLPPHDRERLCPSHWMEHIAARAFPLG